MIISIVQLKGGCGKSTTAAALAQAAAARGDNALLIDLDPQANASFLAAADPALPGSFEMLNGMTAAECIQTTPQGVDIIVGSPDLAAITSSPGSATRVKTAIEPIKGRYTHIIIDTPATAGEGQYNALTAGDYIIIPMQATALDFQSYYLTMDAIQAMQPDAKAGILFTMHDGRSIVVRSMRKQIERAAAEMNVKILGQIRKSVSVQESAALQRSIFEYAKKSKPAQDYMDLYDLIQTL